jgi:hypothetical protein
MIPVTRADHGDRQAAHALLRTGVPEGEWEPNVTSPTIVIDGAVPEGTLTLSVCGETKDRKGNGVWQEASGGQCLDELLKVTDFAAGWSSDRARRLHALWTRWHLNDMRAGCAHMAVTGNGYDANRHLVCPVTGYRFGRAWLVEPMPDAVLAEARSFL